MRSNRMKASSWATLLVLGAAGVTACGQGLTDSASRHSRVVLNVRSLLGAVIGGDFLSVVDTAHLTIASGGEELTLTQLLGPGDDETTFDVTVEEGAARFSVDVISNTGRPLYRGETSTTIAEDDFAVSITPAAINPVMVVTPRRPTFVESNNDGRFFTAIVRVRSAGLDSLRWRVIYPGQLPTGFTFSCFIPSLSFFNCLNEIGWSLARSDLDIILTFGAPQTGPIPSQGVRFVSNVGNVTIPTVP